MAQADEADKTILVRAAGNAHGNPCDPTATAHCINGEVNAVLVECCGCVRAWNWGR
ncbi:MAG: hypothetical protein OXC12_05400 [Spirochaetaceae bacterium]|nr:hypothetical protein [Spirochaetaceae bacterium]